MRARPRICPPGRFGAWGEAHASCRPPPFRPCGDFRRFPGAGPRAGRGDAGRALRRPGRDGPPAWPGRGGILLGAGHRFAHAPHRGPLPEAPQGHGGSLSRRLRVSRSSRQSRPRSPTRSTDRMRSRLGRPRSTSPSSGRRRRSTRAFVGAALACGDGPAVGEAVILSGYGTTGEGDWKSGGRLRSRDARGARPCLEHARLGRRPDGRVAGACSGDSGAPIWSADGATAVAIAAWAQAPHGRGCGGLTQGPRLAPLKAWIEETSAEARQGRVERR